MSIRRSLCCLALAGCALGAAAQTATVTYEYDALGRLVSTDYPNGNITDYTYDDAGNRLSVVTAPPPPNNAPIAVDDAYTQDVSTTVDYDVVANDTDADSDPLTLTAVTGSGASIVSNQLRYAAPSTAGTYTVDYDISDGNGGTDTGTVTLTVEALPVLARDAAGNAVAPYYITTDTIPGGYIYTLRSFPFLPVITWQNSDCNTPNPGSLAAGYSFTGNGCEIRED